MCGRAMYHKQQVRPGSYMNYTVLGNKVIAGKWGMFQGKGIPQSNVRVESLRTTWVQYIEQRGVLELDGFFEKGFYFHAQAGSLLKLPIIFDENYDFSLITKDAKGLVRDVHIRQPILLDDERENSWLEHGKIFNLPEAKLFRINENKLPQVA
jgi:putative SOS response-associated peptidase YedK